MREVKALVPKLRFPEFRGADAWMPKELGDCLGYLQPAPFLVASTNYNDKYGTRVVTAGKTFILGYTDEVDGIFSNTLPVIIFDDFTTASQFVEFPFKAKSSAMKILLAKDGVNIKFIYKSMQQIQYEVGAHGRHWISAYSKIKIPLPKPAEQQKIADCLGSLDELIAAQARKVDALKTHKKGLMQQLFPREGENLPRLRFPEFLDTVAWKKISLKEVFSIFQGFAFSSGDSVDDGVRWLKIADVGIQRMNHDTPSYLPTQYQKQFSKFSVLEGDYVIALTRPILNGHLKIAQVDQVYAGALLNQRVGKLTTNQHISFVYFLLQSEVLINDIEKSISGAEPPNLSTQQMEDLKTRIPGEPEQRRIADCLTSLDDCITAQAQELEALKTHKKGLMQQLFPSPEEVAA